MTASRDLISPRFVEGVVTRIATNQRVRRALPGWGRINVERQLPYLVVYRKPQSRPDSGTDRLAIAVPAYLTAPADRAAHPGVRALTRGVATALSDVFGAVLIVELWVDPNLGADAVGPDGVRPQFRITVPRRLASFGYVDELQARLGRIRILKHTASVTSDPGAATAPPDLRPLLSPTEATEARCHLIGVAMAPVHQSPGGEEYYPLVGRELRRQLGRALGHTFYEFAHKETPRRPRSYHDLGRRAMVKAVWDADRRLAEVGSEFDLLLSVTPVNTEQAWSAFRRRRYGTTPTFRYRPLTVDPSTLKRRLHGIRLDGVEDPTVAHLFHEQRDRLDRQLTLLADRDRPPFLFGSLALFGDVDPDLQATARNILERIEPQRTNGGRSLGAAEIAAMAQQELRRYRQLLPDLAATVELRDDVSSLMVSRGNLLVGRSVRIPARRAEALIQHEIGTHVVTHVNGSQQRFRMLASGLAGYEELQEGMGVFAEYAVGGLSAARLRLLAARVLAAAMVVDGATFVETFRRLTAEHGMPKRPAFLVAMRVHRGGGFVKDAVYLRGVAGLFDYLADGGDLATIFVGKVAMDHAGVVEELLRRQVVREPALLPTYFEDEGARARVDRVRRGLTLGDVTEELRRKGPR